MKSPRFDFTPLQAWELEDIADSVVYQEATDVRLKYGTRAARELQNARRLLEELRLSPGEKITMKSFIEALTLVAEHMPPETGPAVLRILKRFVGEPSS